MTTTSKVTATGLSEILNNEISHDRITQFLSKDLWNNNSFTPIVVKSAVI